MRIIMVPVTHDEARTWLDFVNAPYRNIIAGIPVTANNHILNSLLSKFFTRLFNDSPFFLRLPNLLAQLIYLFAGYKLLQKIFSNNLWVIAGMLLFNLNPFLFNFWGLSRGYGLAIAYMLLAIYFFLNYRETAKAKWLFLSFTAALLATYSNFALLNFYQALCGVTSAYVLFENKKQWQRVFLCIIICSIVIWLLIGHNIIALRSAGELYFGGSKGFISDTVHSLVAESLFADTTDLKVSIISTIIVAIGVGTIFVIIYAYYMHGTKDKYMLVYICLFFFIPVYSTIVQHNIFGTLYLIERTALFFYPLFILFILIACHSISSNISLIFIFWIAAWEAIGFYTHYNISYARNWQYDRYNILVLDRVAKATPHKAKMKIYWLPMYSCKYYAQTSYSNEIDYIEDRFEHIYPDTAYDYYFIHCDEWLSVPIGYRIDTTFFDNKYILLKKQTTE